MNRNKLQLEANAVSDIDLEICEVLLTSISINIRSLLSYTLFLFCLGVAMASAVFIFFF